MEVLLVGQADSIFFEHYTKTIKKKREDINFDVFSVDNIKGKYDLSACTNVYVNDWEKSFIKKIRGVRSIIKPFYTWISLYRFLKRNKKKYDIIHFKWLIPDVVLFPNVIKKYTKKTIATFWGGELETQKILFSNKLYFSFLDKFLNSVDAIANRSEKIQNYTNKVVKGLSKYQKAHYSSSIAGEIEKLLYNESKNESRIHMGIPPEKISIAIGYSGKSIHQHIKIINALLSDTEFFNNKDNYIFLLQMTYGSNEIYINEVETLLKNYNVPYFLFTKKISDVEIARLRNSTDIMIQLSKFDGLSASIIESLLAGSILISGEWLPYKIFKEKQLHYYELKTIDNSLPKLILKISKNINAELKKCQSNKDKMNFNTWDQVIVDWINIYDKILRN